MLFPGSQQGKPENNSIGLRDANSTVVDTNTVLQSALQLLPAKSRSQMNLRCEELPPIGGNLETLERLFRQLLQLITTEKEGNETKLYLHIKNAPSPEASFVLIQFHTNWPAGQNWPNKDQEKNLSEMVSSMGGNLTVNQLKNTGSIYALLLPGKQN